MGIKLRCGYILRLDRDVDCILGIKLSCGLYSETS